jgi:membrane fusion protein (multidrug efflux system)
MRKTSIVLIFALSISTLVACGGRGEATSSPPPAEVKVAEVIVRDVPIYSENVGQTRGSTEVEIRARVEGFLDAIHFQEGSFVEKGQLLYTIDDRDYRAQLSSAEGRLAEAEASFARVTQDVERYRPLVEQNAIPRQEFETTLANQAAAKARVDSARSDVARAQLNLEYTRITSPIGGLAGKTEVKPGNLVGRGQTTLLTTISKTDPINVRFSIPERDYLHVARRVAEAAGGRVPAEQDAAAEARFDLILADGTTHDHKGSLVFADRIIDPETGTLLIEASFPNPELIVRPGQFARVRVAVDTMPDAILVPQRAIQELQATYSVAVVNSSSKVEMRDVEVGEMVGSLRVIREGLRPQERVVVEGLQKIRPGIEVSATMVDPEAMTGDEQAESVTEG